MKTLLILLPLVALASGLEYKSHRLYDTLVGLKNNETQNVILVKINKSWHDGEKYCKELGGDLLKIEEKVENKKLYRHLGVINYKRVWIGLNTSDKDRSVYTWSKDSSKPAETFWGPLEPNNFRNHNERCVEMRRLAKNDDYHNWNDAPCDRKYHFICEGVTSYPPE